MNARLRTGQPQLPYLDPEARRNKKTSKFKMGSYPSTKERLNLQMPLCQAFFLV